MIISWNNGHFDHWCLLTAITLFHGITHTHSHFDHGGLLLSGSRSEALASLLLELHGLQDMLDGLWEWVSGAETTMANTEASSVGNDLETVEAQLALHEACLGIHLIYIM